MTLHYKQGSNLRALVGAWYKQGSNLREAEGVWYKQGSNLRMVFAADGDVVTPSMARLLVTDDAGNELWNINPDNPDDESGDYGNLGNFPSGLTTPVAMAGHDGMLLIADNGGDELWNINPDNPGQQPCRSRLRQPGELP